MKKLLSVLLLLALVAVLAACTGGSTGTESDSVSESVSSSETASDTVESATATETDSETESASETASETESETVSESESESATVPTPPAEDWGALSGEEKAQKMQALDQAVPDRVQPIYGYGCPSDEGQYEKVLTAMKDVGLTGVVSITHFNAGFALGDLCEACEELGLDLLIDTHVDTAASEEEMQRLANSIVQKVALFKKDYDCIRGVYLRDEPTMTVFPTLGVARKALLDRFGEELLVFANLLPFDDPAYEPGSLDKGYGYEARGWVETVREYLDVVDPTLLCFDRYPWYTSKESVNNTPQNLVGNILAGRTVTDVAGIPIWAFLQITSAEGEPSESELLLTAHLALASGTDTLIAFTSYQTSRYTGLIDYKGDTTHMYSRMMFMTRRINAMKCVYRDFRIEKVMTPNNPVYKNALTRYQADSFYTEQYGVLTATTVDDGAGFIGCGVDDAGRNGFYLVNTGYVGEAPNFDVTLEFAAKYNWQIWGEDGLEDIGSGETLSLSLYVAEGKFVIVEPIE